MLTKPSVRAILTRTLKSIVMYAVFGIAAHLTTVSYRALLSDPLSYEAAVVPPAVYAIIGAASMLLLFNTVVRIFLGYERTEPQAAETAALTSGKPPFLSAAFRIDAAVLLMFTAVVSTGFFAPFHYLTNALFPLTPLRQKILQSTLWFSLLLALLWVRHRRARPVREPGGSRKQLWWRYKKFPKAVNWTAEALGYCTLYVITFNLLPTGIYIASKIALSFAGFEKQLLSVLLILCIAAAALFFGHHLRAIFIRRKFLRQMYKICRKKEIPLTPKKVLRPYRSLFRLKDGCDFSLESGGRTYSVKLLSGKRGYRQMILTAEGGLHRKSFRMRGAELIAFESAFDYTFEGEGEKILLLSPVPRFLYIHRGGSLHPADTGDRIGEYRIFNGSGFLGALERDCLHR